MMSKFFYFFGGGGGNWSVVVKCYQKLLSYSQMVLLLFLLGEN